MQDTVITCDGHTNVREAMEMWFRNNQNRCSPKTNQVLTTTQLFPIYALKNVIEATSGFRESLKNFSTLMIHLLLHLRMQLFYEEYSLSKYNQH